VFVSFWVKIFHCIVLYASILHGYGETGLQRFWSNELDLLGSRDIGHVTIGLCICGFLLMVHCNHGSILHRYRNLKSQIYWGHDLDLLGSRDVITWPSDSAWVLSYWWSMMTMRLSCTDTRIWGFKDFGVTSLTFWDHMTSSVTFPLDSAYVVFYWWSTVTMHLSCMYKTSVYTLVNDDMQWVTHRKQQKS